MPCEGKTLSVRNTKGESTDGHDGGGAKRMTQLKDGGRQPGNREERSLSASTVIARWQGNGEPCKSRGLRTVLWAAGGEIPPADPAGHRRPALPRSQAAPGLHRRGHD